MSIIHIKPAPDSRAFKTNITETTYETKEGSDEKRMVSEDIYKGERWDGSIQYDIPRFIYSKNRFTILNPLDPSTELTASSPKEAFIKLNEYVQQCYFKYEKGHPREGQLITEANIFDDADPFFTHNSLFLKRSAGEAFVDDELPVNKVMLLILPTFRDTMYGGNRVGGNIPVGIKTIIVDEQVDKTLYNVLRKNRARAQQIIGILKNDDKIKMALALGLIGDPDFNIISNLDDLDILLDEYAFDTKPNAVANKFSKQEYFIYVYEKGAPILNATWLFHKGKKEGIIKNFQGFYQAFGTTLGKTYDDAITYIATSAVTNDEVRDKIYTAIKAVAQSNLIDSTQIGNNTDQE